MAPNAPPQGKSVAIKNVGKLFVSARSTQHALASVTLDIRPGEFVSIVGPSGCGKSTLLRIVAGLDFPSSGTVLVNADAVRGPRPDHGVVFQKPNLFPWLSVLSNVLFGPRMQSGRRGKAAARPDALHYLKAVGLAGAEDRPVYELSGGMMHRVALARVLINHPGLMLMDEPFAALDAQTRLSMQELVGSIWQRERPSVLFITHDVEEALILSDRVAVMTAAPGSIKSEVVVDLPRPRDTTVITSPRFTALKAQLLTEIRVEVQITAARQEQEFIRKTGGSD
jgi:ABC-type nitrate/sulfonate/bicarbonate transport system ATPase subunit